MPKIPTLLPEVVKTTDIPQDTDYCGLRVVRFQSNAEDQKNFTNSQYQFQSPHESSIRIPAIISRKGFLGKGGRPRIVATIHPNLQLFVDMVKYDPSCPPIDNYNALGMKQMHERTQSDFKGQKSKNKNDFADYILEGVRGDRTLFLPTISGWQSEKVFEKTVFVAFDETDPNSMYGLIYLPNSPIMQADGQTQTAALFAVANSKEAQESGALEDLLVTLEVELNVDVREAGQSFADRNGRGTKKNKNLVISLDTSSALSELRMSATEGTVFEGRIADGRTGGTSETATNNIIDLSTSEQMIINAISDGRLKAQHFRYFHVAEFRPFVKEFFELLSESFKDAWIEKTPKDSDPFRRLYVHGWAFALKAIALAYYRSRIDTIGPIQNAVGAKIEGKTAEEAFKAAIEEREWDKKPQVSFDELKRRLNEIDWLRYRKHWVSLTGFKVDKKTGKPKLVKLKSLNGEERVAAQAQNTQSVIGAVATKILSNSWEELTKSTDYKV